MVFVIILDFATKQAVTDKPFTKFNIMLPRTDFNKKDSTKPATIASFEGSFST